MHILIIFEVRIKKPKYFSNLHDESTLIIYIYNVINKRWKEKGIQSLKWALYIPFEKWKWQIALWMLAMHVIRKWGCVEVGIAPFGFPLFFLFLVAFIPTDSIGRDRTLVAFIYQCTTIFSCYIIIRF